MTLPTTISGQVAINATDVWPRLHAEHGDGRHSLALTPENEAVSIYVRGTHAELLDLAAKIVASVPRDDDDNDEHRLGTFGCETCGQTLIHDCARYWFCANLDCADAKRTVLIHRMGGRSFVGVQS